MKFLFLLLSLNSLAIIETNNFNSIFDKLEKVLLKHAPEKILFVTDLDNTILATQSDVASDQWISYQANLINNNSQSPLKVFDDFPTLIDAWHSVMKDQKMRKTEDYIPKKIKSLQVKGVDTMILTSRAHIIRKETMRELTEHNFDFDKKPFSQSFRSILDNSDRTIDFKNGIAMTEGAHKGHALDFILKKLNKTYDVIFFIDDHKKHTVRVEEILSKKSTVYSFRYGKEDINVNAYKNSIARISKSNKLLLKQYLKNCSRHL